MATDWLKYANQGATRNLPLDPKLVEALSFLPGMGVTMEVFSGGQPSSGANRVGSHRHDHGNAGDVFFYKDGKKLDWANPQDRPIFENIVKKARGSGITGIGAGPGYMQPGSMHIGFGAPSAWGAGGKSANAPEWLSNAFGNPVKPDMGSMIAEAQQPAPIPAFADRLQGQDITPPAPYVPGAVAAQPSSGPIASGAPAPPLSSTQIDPPSPQMASAQSPMKSLFSSFSPPAEGGKSPLDMLAAMSAMQPEQPQFQPVQIQGPSPQQAQALTSFIEALRKRLV